LTTGIVLLGDKLINYVFDPKYFASLPVLVVIVSFQMVNNLQRPVELVLQALEKVNIIFYSKVFAIYNIILDLIIIKAYGVVGVAIVTGTAVLFQGIFYYYFANKYISLDLDLKRLSIILSNCFIMAIPVYFLRNTVQNLASFILVVCIGLLIYLTASFVNKAFSDEERKMLNKVLVKPVFVF